MPKCQAGIYCSECAELCPIFVDNIIYHCHCCAEVYCLLCPHEFGYCLICEANVEAVTTVVPLLPPLNCQRPVISSNLALCHMCQAPANPTCQIKSSSTAIKGKHARWRKCSARIDSEVVIFSTSEDELQRKATVFYPAVMNDDLLSEGNLTILHQLHHHVWSLEGKQQHLKRVVDFKDIIICNLRDKMK